MDAALQAGDKCQYHSPPKDEDSLSTQETPTILGKLNDLLRSPYPPSHADIQQIHLCIERESNRCNQEIASEQLKPSTHIDLCRSLLAPIRRLPNEILENVFAMTCLSEHGCYSLRVYDAPKHERKLPRIAPTLTLTHVSYRWRLLVNGSAGLWSSIKVELTARTKGRMNIEPLLDLYLTRSKEYPLDLRFWQYPGCDDTLIASMICPHIPRITRLDLCTETEDSSIPLHVPNLDQLWDAFRTKAPRLSTVKMVYVLGWFNWLPYHQLVNLEIQEVYDCSDLIRLIQLCTRLHTLKLSMRSRVTYADLRIEVPSVRSLSIAVNEHLHTSLISQQLVFPSLVSLEISLYRTTSLVPLIGAWHHLRELVLETFPQISTMELCLFLASCPELSKLQVYDLHYRKYVDEEESLTYKLFKALCHAPTEQVSEVVAPRLTELRVYERNSLISSEMANTLLDMLETRIAALDDDNRSKWDIGVEKLWECTEDVVEAFHARQESLGKRGLVCSIKWAKVVKEWDP